MHSQSCLVGPLSDGSAWSATFHDPKPAGHMEPGFGLIENEGDGRYFGGG